MCGDICAGQESSASTNGTGALSHGAFEALHFPLGCSHALDLPALILWVLDGVIPTNMFQVFVGLGQTVVPRATI